jgi:hypothetical protein
MIEWRWGLEPLTARDANANNLLQALDFERENETPHRAIPVADGEAKPAGCQQSASDCSLDTLTVEAHHGALGY